MYRMTAEAWLQYVVGKLKTHGNQRPSAAAVMPYPIENTTTLSTGRLGDELVGDAGGVRVHQHRAASFPFRRS